MFQFAKQANFKEILLVSLIRTPKKKRKHSTLSSQTATCSMLVGTWLPTHQTIVLPLFLVPVCGRTITISPVIKYWEGKKKHKHKYEWNKKMLESTQLCCGTEKSKLFFLSCWSHGAASVERSDLSHYDAGTLASSPTWRWSNQRRLEEVPFVLVGHMDQGGMFICRVHHNDRTWGRLRFANQVGETTFLVF